ncbi:hypothetical protein N8Z47_01265 [Salibacteraceae bacterium]|nr:hypothetical protein [Salibacteraceae bacterium]
MKKASFIFAIGIAAVLISCDKDEETVTTYIYAQGLEEGESAKLFIDDEYETELSNLNEEPQFCDENSLSDCYIVELPHGKHDYRLESQKKKEICSGYVKFKPNRMSAGANHGQGGKMHSSSDKDQKRVLIGLNSSRKMPSDIEDCE